jgi:hypothetical protein
LTECAAGPENVRWPTVPACYGWLSLDRRGNWRLKGEVVRHAGLIAFINRNYASDAFGNWVFRNGPQKVYVTLDYAPLVLRLGIGGELVAHTGMPAGEATAAFIDEEGSALLQVGSGIGLLDDRDLPAFLAACVWANGKAASDAALPDLMLGGSGISWRGLPLQAIRRSDLARCFNFQPAPAP